MNQRTELLNDKFKIRGSSRRARRSEPDGRLQIGFLSVCSGASFTYRCEDFSPRGRRDALPLGFALRPVGLSKERDRLGHADRGAGGCQSILDLKMTTRVGGGDDRGLG